MADENSIESRLKKLNVKRDSKLGVGKRIGNQIWVHSYYSAYILDYDELTDFKSVLPKGFAYDLLRWDKSKNELAFISSPDFDTAQEPLVGLIYRVVKEGDEYLLLKAQKPPSNPLVYHHKWTFVKDGYHGFDVEKSKLRSESWKSVMGIDRTLSSKIGRLSFWNEWLAENGLLPRVHLDGAE